MTFAFLGFIAVMITMTLFLSRQYVLGFVSALFWFLLGGYSYTQFTTPWVDWQYYLMFISFFVGVMMPFAAYSMRKQDISAIDEMVEPDEFEQPYYDEKKPESRLERIRRKSRAYRRSQRTQNALDRSNR